MGGAVAIAKAIYELGGFVSLARGPRTQAALTLAEQSLDVFRDAARRLLQDQQISAEEQLDLQRALEELDRREAFRTRAENNDPQAIQLLRAMRKRERPLERYPDPGDPVITEIIEEQPARRQRTLEGAVGVPPALEDVERGQMALQDVQTTAPGPPRLTTYRTNTDFRMDNGLILRLHQSNSNMYLELLQPPNVNNPNTTSLGRTGRMDNPGSAPTAASRRLAAFQRAQLLQPSSIEELMEIYRTSESQAAASSSSGPVAPVPKARSKSRPRPANV
jgi:hypothetical protein